MPSVRVETIAEHVFDVDDPKKDFQTIRRPDGQGAASYVNGSPESPYCLRFVCYDDYLHQFVFDDGGGHSNVNLLKDGLHCADFIVYDSGENRAWLIVHELSKGAEKNKRSQGRLQLSNTLDMLCKSPEVKELINGFKNKWCVLSAHDERIVSPMDMAAPFMLAYTVLPEPREFHFGSIRRFGFRAFETSKVVLS